MREIVEKMVMFESITWYHEKKPCKIVFKVDHLNHKIAWRTVAGPLPYLYALMQVCMYDRDIRKEIEWSLKSYKRKYPIYMGCQENASARYYWLRYSKEPGNWFSKYETKEAFRIHVSCYGKTEFPELFSGDLTELLAFLFERIDRVKLCELFSSKPRRWFRYLRPRSVEGYERESVCGSLDLHSNYDYDYYEDEYDDDYDE